MSRAASRSVARLAMNQKMVFVTLLAVLVIAPLLRAGKPPLATLVLELTALSGVVIVLWGNALRGVLRTSEITLISLLLVIPFIGLLPIPSQFRTLLPGQAPYYEVLAAVGFGTASDAMTTLSLSGDATFEAWLMLLIPVAVFLMTRALRVPELMTLVNVFCVVCATQAVIGLIQVSADDNLRWYYGVEYTHLGSAVGTFTSKNNYVTLMYFGLLIAMARTFASFAPTVEVPPGGQHKTHSAVRSLITHPRALGSALLCFLLLLAILYSRSRAGIVLAGAGVIVLITALSRHLGGRSVYGFGGTLLVITTACAIAMGIGPVLERFTELDPMDDNRWTLYADVLEAIKTFFPLGSGLGTFQEVFPRFQDLSLAGVFVNRAHNSYLEWTMTGGAPVLVLIVVLLLAYAWRWTRLGAYSGEFRFIQTAAGIGMLLMLLHDTVDYNFFVPANTVYFAFFAGLFFHHHADHQTQALHTPVRRASPTPPIDEVIPLLAPRAGDPALEDNPFLRDERPTQRHDRAPTEWGDA